MRVFAAMCALSLLVPVAAESQQRSHGSAAARAILAPGARLRFVYTWSRQKVKGTVSSLSRDSVVVDTVDYAAQHRLFMPAAVPVDDVRHMTVRLAQVDSVEVSLGKSRSVGALRAGLKGALIGGAILGVQALSGRTNPSFGQFADGFLAGAIAGASIGGPIGYARGHERWRSVPKPSLVPSDDQRPLIAEGDAR
ncbi:MAG TPA: hypothetical protein VNA89_15020 [Gemmatimonadaceae bacterium]|nr:hypothetical protein [Gemmatimonadaceae bacterium]